MLMPLSFEFHKREFAKWLLKLDQGIITEREAGHGVMGECLQVLEGHPHEWPGFSAAVASLSTPILASASAYLDATRLPEGGWRWPTIGAIGDKGPTVFRTASPDEAAVRETLSAWLRERAGGQDAEPLSWPTGLNKNELPGTA